MSPIAICIVLHNNFLESKVCIDNLLKKTNVPVKLYILNNASTDQRIEDYFKPLCTENQWEFQSTTELKNLSQSYNILLKTTNEQYCCIFPINTLVHKNWLEDLVYTFGIVKEPIGMLGIRYGTEKTFLMPILNEHPLSGDELYNVWFTENNSVEGVLFFRKNVFDQPGYFDEKFQAPGYETAEMVFRISAFGFRNFYIRNQTAVKALVQNEVLFPKKTKPSMEILKNEIESMVKEKQFSK